MSHPWRMLRDSTTEIIWTTDPDVLGGCKAAWYPGLDVIAMSPRLTQVERRSSLAHELAHRHRHDQPIHDPRQEVAADLWAARLLIPLDALTAALQWSSDPHEVADELWVTVHLLGVRLAHLTPDERAHLARRLGHADESTPTPATT